MATRSITAISARDSGVGLCEIFLVADLLHPLDHLAVERLLKRDVGHWAVGRGAVPVAAAGRAEDDVAGADFLPRLARALVPAGAGDDDQSLAERVRVPGRARPGGEAHQGAGKARRIVARELPFDGDFAGEVFGRAFDRRLAAAADDVHGGGTLGVRWGAGAVRGVRDIRLLFSSARQPLSDFLENGVVHPSPS